MHLRTNSGHGLLRKGELNRILGREVAVSYCFVSYLRRVGSRGLLLRPLAGVQSVQCTRAANSAIQGAAKFRTLERFAGWFRAQSSEYGEGRLHESPILSFHPFLFMKDKPRASYSSGVGSRRRWSAVNTYHQVPLASPLREKQQ